MCQCMKLQATWHDVSNIVLHIESYKQMFGFYQEYLCISEQGMLNSTGFEVMYMGVYMMLWENSCKIIWWIL